MPWVGAEILLSQNFYLTSDMPIPWGFITESVLVPLPKLERVISAFVDSVYITIYLFMS